MKSRLSGRVNAVVLVLILALAPSAAFSAPRDRDAPQKPGDRIVRIIKQIKNLFAPAVNDDAMTPPKP